jgi:uncharacterized protein (DUF486 family)
MMENCQTQTAGNELNIGCASALKMLAKHQTITIYVLFSISYFEKEMKLR